MLVSLTVGKVDAGVAVLLTEDKRLIEFPSILLPPDIHSGSIVDINVARNTSAEEHAEQRFASLQSTIFQTFGQKSPSPPVLRCRNVTQTSIVLEWDPIELATAELRSLSLYGNGVKAGVIPRGKLSTKISGLAVDMAVEFHLVLRTSAGVYSSERIKVRTQKMEDLTGITITPGVMPGQLRESLGEAVSRIGAKLVEQVRIDTTHFVCTEPRGSAWEKAVEMNVPVVVPDWVLGCEREGRVVGVRGYYLDANPRDRVVGPGVGVGVSQQQGQGGGPRVSVGSVPRGPGTPRIEHTPPTPERPRAEGRGVGGEEAKREAPTSQPQSLPERPAVPSKAESGRESEDSEESHDDTANGYAAVGDSSKVAQREVSDDEDDESGDDEGERPGSKAGPGKPAANGDETTDKEAQQMAEEDGRFDEVAL